MSEVLQLPTCFISYAHIDREIIARITVYLQEQEINVWIDREGIIPGSPDWEAALRVAIQSSQAVILIASPYAPSSRYIRDELALAQYYQIPVYPFWITGEVWIESVPLGWGSAQYIDARGDRFEESLAVLADTLKASSIQSKNVQRSMRHRVLPPQPADEWYVQQRENIVQEIYTLLTSREVTAVILEGIGGVGKSTLAALVFNYSEDLRLIGRGYFLAEPIWLRVETGMTVFTLVEKLFNALGKLLPDLKTLSSYDLMQLIMDTLNTLKLPRLIIFDQFENFLDWQTGQPLPNRLEIREMIDMLSSQQCASRILLTSRSTPAGMRISKQSHLKIYSINGMGDSEGIELLRKRGISVSRASDDELLPIVQKVSGHALGIILISSILQRNRSVNVKDLFASPLYTHLWLGDIAENLLDYIYKQLNSTHRKLLQIFSVYREPIPLEAIRVFLFKVSDRQLITSLDALLAQHLLQAIGEERYQLHAIIIGYVQQKMRKRGQKNTRDMHEKAAQYYLDKAATSRLPFGKRRQTSDVQSLLESIWHLCQANQWQRAYQLLEQEHLFTNLRSQGNNITLLELYQLLLPVSRWSHDYGQSGHVYERVATLYFVVGQAEQALRLFEQALMAYKQAKDNGKQASILTRLGEAYDSLGDKKQARMFFEQAVQAYNETEDYTGKGDALIQLAWICQYDGELPQAIEYIEQALGLLERGSAGDRSIALAYSKLGAIYHEQKRYEEARKNFEQALLLFNQAKSRGMGAWTLGNLALIHEELGQNEQARVLLEGALQIFQEVKDRRGEGWILNRLGKVYIDRDQIDSAYNTLYKALYIFQEINERNGQGIVNYHLGYFYQHKEQFVYAQDWYEKAWDIQEEILDFKGAAQTLHKLGLLFFSQKDYEAALASLLLASSYSKRVHSFDIDSINQSTTLIEQEIGQSVFALLQMRISSQASEIVRKRIHDAKAAAKSE